MAAMASWVVGSVPMALKRTRTRATCLSGLMRPALVCSSPVVGDSTRSTPAGLSGPGQPGGELADERRRGALVDALPPVPASTTSTALEGETRSGKYFLTTSLASRLGADEGRKARWSLTATSSMFGRDEGEDDGRQRPRRR